MFNSFAFGQQLRANVHNPTSIARDIMQFARKTHFWRFHWGGKMYSRAGTMRELLQNGGSVVALSFGAFTISAKFDLCVGTVSLSCVSVR